MSPLAELRPAEDEVGSESERELEAVEREAEEIARQNAQLEGAAAEEVPRARVRVAAPSALYRAPDESVEREKALKAAREKLSDLQIDRAVLQETRIRKREAAVARIVAVLRWASLAILPIGVGIFTMSLAWFLGIGVLVALAGSLFWLLGNIKPDHHQRTR